MNFRIIALAALGAIIFAACASPNTTTPTPTAVEIAVATATASPRATSTSLPTATATSTPTPTATATTTLEPTPTATALPATAPPATPRYTATPRPTAVPPTATAAPSSVSVPPPQVFQFDAGGFMKYLDYAKQKYATLKGFVGGAAKGDYVGSCNLFIQFRGELLGIVAFSGAPEQWQAIVDEYHDFRTQAITVIDPIEQICLTGGGSVDAETDRRILDLLDRAQNRMYQMLQQAKTMTQ
jgi:hypothetical protein